MDRSLTCACVLRDPLVQVARTTQLPYTTDAPTTTTPTSRETYIDDKDDTRKFIPYKYWNLYKKSVIQAKAQPAKNLFVVADFKHVVTIHHQIMPVLFEHVFVPQVPDSCNLILDCSIGFSKYVAIQATMLRGEILRTSDVTDQIESADVGFFSYVKSLMKRFYSQVVVHELPFDLKKGYNILKASVGRVAGVPAPVPSVR
ncbi:unnamed protein product [Heligmosomoides polygyrus]|uniref:BTB domain-containing protein n=1 Tax=Heligmosomoides polygyrus TaxID=6339 RepID=A0A183G986_HELPZ|nr:unnamed protein product [Heligmosomoides polygyrus]